jgi:exodeoxyribonuclease-3
MKIITYNVNGIRSAINKNWLAWVQATDADVICLQEIKATPEVVTELHLVEALGYKHYWFPAEKKGYSGTAILTKRTPNHIEYGCGIPDFDREGRNIRVDFDEVSVMSVYFPSGSSGEDRQAFKFRFLDEFGKYLTLLKVTHPAWLFAAIIIFAIALLISITQNQTPTHQVFYPRNANGWKTLSSRGMWIRSVM